ncbi:LysR family transcriptional regulator [Streptomyces odontomachi]|uniref:LysR family transcriptional regulator n=1 Tax=Streptomyces odontomachi TaxID=2944940 RepID=UPI00210AD358|nr:LysR family transcriptional regulator [Streptomyces sp. ODS25]
MDLTRVHPYRTDWIASFVAVARHGGFSAAAKALYRSQPRVSSHVAELEHQLGVRLLDRSVQPARLTPEGRGLLPHAEEILRRLNVLADVADGTAHGEVRLGAHPSAAGYLYPLAVRALRTVHPHVRLVLREGPSVGLDADLADGSVDLAVRPLLPLATTEGITHRLLWREPLVAVFRADHPLARARSVSLAQTAELPLVAIGENGEADGRQYETDLAFADAGLTPVVAARTSQPQTLVSLVRHGLGVGVTNCLAMTTANLEGVSLVPLDDPRCERAVAVWWRSDGAGSPAVEATREVIGSVPAPRWPWADRTARPAPHPERNPERDPEPTRTTDGPAGP